jgi:hypothetical protein
VSSSPTIAPCVVRDLSLTGAHLRVVQRAKHLRPHHRLGRSGGQLPVAAGRRVARQVRLASLEPAITRRPQPTLGSLAASLPRFCARRSCAARENPPASLPGREAAGGGVRAAKAASSRPAAISSARRHGWAADQRDRSPRAFVSARRVPSGLNAHLMLRCRQSGCSPILARGMMCASLD